MKIEADIPGFRTCKPHIQVLLPLHRVSMFLLCLSLNFVYLLYVCPSLDISKINIQGYGLARKGHRNAVLAHFALDRDSIE